jgi:hypothetical protein
MKKRYIIPVLTLAILLFCQGVFADNKADYKLAGLCAKAIGPVSGGPIYPDIIGLEMPPGRKDSLTLNYYFPVGAEKFFYRVKDAKMELHDEGYSIATLTLFPANAPSEKDPIILKSYEDQTIKSTSL